MIKELEALHAVLVDTLDAGDTERLDGLIQQRGERVTALKAAHEAADSRRRTEIAPALAHLTHLDQDLQARFRAHREQLGQRLTETRQSTSQAPAPAVSGVFDRRA